MRKALFCSTILLGLAACQPAAKSDGGGNQEAPKATEFKIDKVSLPGEGRGDYIAVDPDANRLYVSHSAVLHILDLGSLKELGEVKGLKAAHGIAIDKASNHGFVTDGEQNAVVMFDLASGATLKTIPAGQKPDAMLRDPASGLILAFDNESSEVTVIDPAKAAVVKTVKLPSNPEFAQADGKGKVWVNMEEASAIAEIDSKTQTVTRTIPLTGCEGPAPLAFDSANRVLFSGCGNKVMTVTDADSGKVLTTVPVGEDPDGIVFDPDKKRIFVANRKGGWTIIDQQAKDKYVVNQTLPIDEYAKTVALDPGSHRVFTSTADLIWPKPTPGKKLLPNAAPGSFRLMVVTEK